MTTVTLFLLIQLKGYLVQFTIVYESYEMVREELFLVALELCFAFLATGSSLSVPTPAAAAKAAAARAES